LSCKSLSPTDTVSNYPSGNFALGCIFVNNSLE